MKKTKTIRFVDCGGNVGQSIHWSLNILDAFSELFDCNVKVDCFEPYPQLFEIIKGNPCVLSLLRTPRFINSLYDLVKLCEFHFGSLKFGFCVAII